MWRNSGLPLKFFGIDYRVVLVLCLMLYNFSWTVFYIMVTTIIVLSLLERAGFTIPNAIRKLHVFLIGPRRLAVSSRRFGSLHK